MGLEYNIGKLIEEEEKLNDLRLELAPRGQCRSYIINKGGKAILLTREEFDSYYYEKEFVDGPNVDNFGDGPGEPYFPNRQAFGKLKDGRIIYCELSKVYKEKTKTLFDIVDSAEKKNN